jgi:hypothetical protein
MVQTRQQIESDEHYAAMRTIEIIRSDLAAVPAKVKAQLIDSWLPVAVNKLLYGAKQEADAFLQLRRKNVHLIGQVFRRYT